MASNNTPHVVLIPLPAQGHAPPTLRLAELLSNADNFFITFVNTESTHHHFLNNSPSLCDRLSQNNNFRFRTIPDGVAKDTNAPVFHQFIQILDSMRTKSSEPLKKILMDAEDWPPVTCVVVDGAFTLAVDIVEEAGFPVMVFRTSSACSIWTYCCLPQLISGGELPFPEDADMDVMVRSALGLEKIMRRRDLPSMLRSVKSSDDAVIQFLSGVTNNLTRGRALILNTFDALEGDSISRLRSFCPVIYAVGPLHAVGRSCRASMWKEDDTCLTWLDSQPEKSVVYVSFGSITMVTSTELLEFWHGLVSSGHRFLWVLRPDMVKGSVPEEMKQGKSEKRCVVDWAPQVEVLAHPAVGCFLTHSGWNSTVESVTAGVPMICWPFTADQWVNSRFVSEVWKSGLDMKDTCDRNILERMVREVMEDDESTYLKKSVADLAKEARMSIDGGSSYKDLQKLVLHINSLCS